jgi:hypothetical protein
VTETIDLVVPASEVRTGDVLIVGSDERPVLRATSRSGEATIDHPHGRSTIADTTARVRIRRVARVEEDRPAVPEVVFRSVGF